LYIYVFQEPINQQPAAWKRYRRISSLIIGFIIFLGISISAIPTTKEFAAIYLIPKVVNNEQVQKLPDNAVRLMNEKLEQWIEDVRGAKRGK